jgi:PTS system nitrogen regulatory IIA component
MKLSELLTERLISADLQADGKLAVLDELAQLISRAYEGVNADAVARALLDRERIMSTAVGYGVAIPHAKTPAVDRILVCLGLHRHGIDFDAEDGSKTQIFFTLLAPEQSSGEHLKVLARISRICQDKEFRKRLRAAENSAAIMELIRDTEERM